MFLQSTPPQRLDPSWLDTICARGDCLYLRPQQRVPSPPQNKLIVLRDGMLAVDATPEKEKLQVLDFLVAGDLVSAMVALPTSKVSLRAITSASLVAIDSPEFQTEPPANEYWAFLMQRSFHQMARNNLHQLMVGRLESEARVASFLLFFALEAAGDSGSGAVVSLPMSRNDIANYLVINCDTLSRIMMAFCDCGLISRESRHSVRVVDLEGLKQRSPIAALISALHCKPGDPQPTATPLHRADVSRIRQAIAAPRLNVDPLRSRANGSVAYASGLRSARL